MQPGTLNDHLVISLKGPEIEEIGKANLNENIKSWKAKNERGYVINLNV